MNYVRKLGFEETPDYDFLRELFSKVMKSAGEQEDLVFDWMLLNGGKGWEASNSRSVRFISFSVFPHANHVDLSRHHPPCSPRRMPTLRHRTASALTVNTAGNETASVRNAHRGKYKTMDRHPHPSCSVPRQHTSTRPGVPRGRVRPATATSAACNP